MRRQESALVWSADVCPYSLCVYLCTFPSRVCVLFCLVFCARDKIYYALQLLSLFCFYRFYIAGALSMRARTKESAL